MRTLANRVGIFLLAASLGMVGWAAWAESPDQAAKDALVPADVWVAAANPTFLVPNCYGDPNNLLYPLNEGGWTLSMGRNDDGSGPLTALGFPFNFYGSTYSSAFVNNNGNISFVEPYWQYTPLGFPSSSYRMIAGFWADVDTRSNSDPAWPGDVYQKSVDSNQDGAADTFVVTWQNVGYFAVHHDKRDTFQIVLSDGSNPLLGYGNNVCFSYDNMCWTTGDASSGSGGFGGYPATVGANKGDGVTYFQIGRFNLNNGQYDGPYGANDGVDYLDGKLICFSTSGANICPIVSDFPQNNREVLSVSQSYSRSLRFLSPEPNQIATVTWDDPDGAQAAGLSIVSTPGSAATVDLSWTPGCAAVGEYTLVFHVTDNASDPCTINKTLTLRVSCDDGNLCTADTCVAVGGCVHTPIDNCCAQTPPVSCTEANPCDLLLPENRCPAGTPVTEAGVQVEPASDAVCAADPLRVFVTRRGEVDQTGLSTEDVCSGSCFESCFETCVIVPVQHCYEECVLRCGNGACLRWEERCGLVDVATNCDLDCFRQCDENFDPTDHTSRYTAACGQAINDVLEVREAAGGCDGALVESYAVTGIGTAGISLQAPLTPGSYVLCLGGNVVKSFTASTCGPRCRIRLSTNALTLQEGVNATSAFGIENAGAGGSYAISLLRFEDDAHTVPMYVPGFLSVAPSTGVPVPDNGSTSVSLNASNPQPVGGQTHWSNVIVRAQGPATACEATLDVTITTGDCAGQAAGTPCGDTAETPCNHADSCDGSGNCVANYAPVGSPCTDDGDVCTADACDGAGACQHEFSDATPPQIECPAGVISECQSAGQALVSLAAASGSDACSYSVTITNDHSSNGADASGSYPLGSTTVTFTATDGSGNQASCQTVVTVVDTIRPTVTAASMTPSVLWPPNHTMREVAAGYTATDTCSPVTCSLSVASNEPVNGTGDGDTAPDWVTIDDRHLQLRAERAGTGTGRIYTTTVSCSDVSGNSSSSNGVVKVKHDIGSPKSGSAFRIGTTVAFTGTFWDVPGKVHTARWYFDGLSAPGVVTEPAAARPGSVKGAYTFTATGIYAVKMNVADESGAVGTADSVDGVSSLVVVYDPSGGFVSGGGWIDSPAGALASNPSATGKASFGFVSKYFKSATNPKGETEFSLAIADFRFNALNFDYLMISGAKAQYRGTGKVNGGGGFGFLLTVIDGQVSGGGGVDKFRLKIWNKSTGVIVYDNQAGAPDNADPAMIVGTGSAISIQP